VRRNGGGGDDAAVVLRLDPRLTLVWRSPGTLQIGAESPRAVLHDVTRAEELLIEALRIGTTRAGLAVVAGGAGARPADVDRLLHRLGAAVFEDRDPRRPLRVLVETDGTERLAAAATRIAAAVTERGAAITRATTDADLAIVVAAHVVAPLRSATWTARNVPHLAVVFGDASVELGPLVGTAATPCAHCVVRTRLDDDPAWTALAVQLLVETHAAAAASSPALTHDAAAAVIRVIDAVSDRRPTGLEGSSLRIHEDGSVTRRRWPLHPGCSCRVLPGTASAPSAPSGAARSRPRTAAAGIAPG